MCEARLLERRGYGAAEQARKDYGENFKKRQHVGAQAEDRGG
jgi:hypothetical protein